MAEHMRFLITIAGLTVCAHASDPRVDEQGRTGGAHKHRNSHLQSILLSLRSCSDGSAEYSMVSCQEQTVRLDRALSEQLAFARSFRGPRDQGEMTRAPASNGTPSSASKWPLALPPSFVQSNTNAAEVLLTMFNALYSRLSCRFWFPRNHRPLQHRASSPL